MKMFRDKYEFFHKDMVHSCVIKAYSEDRAWRKFRKLTINSLYGGDNAYFGLVMMVDMDRIDRIMNETTVEKK